MPFDAAETVGRSVADQIGLVPVPMEVLDAYKSRVRRMFFADLVHQKHNRLARWQEIPDSVFRTATVEMLTWAAKNLGVVPTDVQTVVGETERRLRSAEVPYEKVLGRFDTDPYVVFKVTEPNGTSITLCVAIWDQGEVVHRAKLI